MSGISLHMPAQQIDCISTERDAHGRRQVTHVGGPAPGGERWKLSIDEVIRAVQGGAIYYATFGAESCIVTFGTAPDGRRFVRIALDPADSTMLLRLPECP